MAVTNFTPLLGLALPTTGDLSGTWGATVNDAITDLLDDAVAGTVTLSANADVTLTTTNGADNQARNAVILWTASNGATTRNITAPAQSKAYVVINAGTGSIVVRGAGPTAGVTVVSGEKCLVAWNGSDFVKISTTEIDGVSTISFGSTGLTPSTATSGAVTVAGTLAVANGGTGATTAPNALTNLAAAGTGISNTFTANQIISVTDNTNAALRITQLGSGNALLVEDTTNPDASPFVIDATGKVVIGATTAVGSGIFQVYNDGATMAVFRKASTDAAGVTSYFQKARGTNASPTIVSSGDALNETVYQGYDGTTFQSAAQITAAVDGTPGASDMPGRLVFSTTADGASTPTERMRIDSAGNIGFATTAPAGTNFRLNYTTSASTNYTVDNQFTIANTTTTEAIGFRSVVYTQAAAFTLTNARHFSTVQATIGAGSVVTTQSGFLADSLTGATNNYAFHGTVAAPTSGIATTGTISTISSSGTTVTVSHDAITYTNGQTVTIAATANATALVSGATVTILTVGTTDYTLIGAASNTVGVSFTATGAGTGTGTVTLNVQGSGKTVAGAASGSFTYTTTTSQTFAAVTVLTGTVTVSTRFNLFMNGTANNFMAGSLGFGSAPSAGQTILLNKSIIGNVNSTQIRAQGTVQSDVTTSVNSFDNVLVTAAAAFTLTQYTHFNAQQVTIGAGSAITNQYGFRVGTSLTGATNNYGFYGDIAAGTNRYNLFMNGTAANRFNGDLLVYGGTAIPAGGTTGSGYKFSSTANFGVFFGSGAPTLSAAKGSLYLRSDGTTTNNRMYVNTDGSTTWTAVTTAA
jgi:hypothetical protein